MSMTPKEAANLLRLLAAEVLHARTKNGARILDASDFRAWLHELADQAEQFPSKKLPATDSCSKKKVRGRLAS